ncbi:MAG: hypothetical protein M3O70_04405, partial [Actinomycetota bacterium]|nr:hypothetical protein [Actinomycetota bacterium]
RLVGLTLNKRGFFSGRRREVLPAEGIHAIGRDAVMILDESSLPSFLPTGGLRFSPGVARWFPVSLVAVSPGLGTARRR